MIAALDGYVILGCTTGIAFLTDVFRHQAFISGQTHTHFIEQHLTDWRPPAKNLTTAMIAAAITSLRRPSVAVNTPGVVDQSPWTTLGGWRMGSGRP
jgi:3-methylcrotonyl-CoA carboxylase alpha subunit